MKLFLTLILLLTLTSCEQKEVQKGHLAQALGESVRPVIFQGEGAGLLPSYDERAVVTMINRLRVNTDSLNIKDQQNNPISPRNAFVYSIGAAEAGRWQGKHGLEFNCQCEAGTMPMDQDYNTCCDIGFVDGLAQCIGPIVSCDDEQATEETDRWAILNNGESSISNEPFIVADFAGWAGAFGAFRSSAFGARPTMFSPAVASIAIAPKTCVQEESSCGAVGTCVDPVTKMEGCEKGGETNPDCIGECVGGARAGGSCIIPIPLGEECLPENYPRQYFWTFGMGKFNGILPVINDGIHLAILGENKDDPPELAFIAHYVDQAGPPQLFNLVEGGKCTPLVKEFARPEGWPIDPLITLKSETYRLEVTKGDFQDGCFKYIFSATDADGFIHSYPSLGSLQAKVVEGLFVSNDEACPIWVPTRVNTACLPVADQCKNSETRICYSGREGTQGKGACVSGTETCVRGRWSGDCKGETLPEAGDTCADEVDNNCNGFVNEGCPIVAPPEKDMGMGEEDMGMQQEKDMGSEKDSGSGNTPKDTVGEEDEGCCTTVQKKPGTLPFLLPLLLLGFALIRRR